MGGRVQRHGRVSVLALLVGLALPGTAAAATVAVGDGALTVTAAPGERNDLLVEPQGELVRVTDAATPPVARDGCAAAPDTPLAVVCAAAPVEVVRVEAGDGDDRLVTRVARPTLLSGGPGDDELTGGAGPERLVGGPGRDTVRYDDGRHDDGVAVTLGGGEDDGRLGEQDDVREVEVVVGGAGDDLVRGTDADETVIGGGGDDVVDLGAGEDRFDGGPGDDACLLGGPGPDVCDGGAGEGDVARHLGSVPMVLSLDGRANDGPRGAATGNLLGIEELIGGEGPDLLVGSDGADRLSGRGGDDVLRGGGGDDVLLGDRGDDTVEGGAGVDRVAYASIFVGGPVRVTLDKIADDGESGERDRIGRDVEIVEGTATAADLLAGGITPVTLRGLGGEDRLVGGTARDVLDGGDGDDRISALDGVRDVLDCGSGLDQVVVDPVDDLRGCEVRGRQRPVLRVTRRTAPSRLRVRCPRVYRAPVRPYARRCRGVVTVQRAGRIVLRRRLDVPSGRGRDLRGPALRGGDLAHWRLDGVRPPVAVARLAP
ncbi:hypothetical protein GKE82_04190 [Conexibacter sp. W3-3-2]|uniref:calcium-binding protein n=1 Tax=Conexibacter sp. W3-3-2 TaxID=2675227 RepID=UPI0012B6CE28|nr:calcium-binding protein [Conexibacter sp. W3-3-2]MTD43522.1 hypothetical protein [Conexibacter sp. W3-3-2]